MSYLIEQTRLDQAHAPLQATNSARTKSTGTGTGESLGCLVSDWLGAVDFARYAVGYTGPGELGLSTLRVEVLEQEHGARRVLRQNQGSGAMPALYLGHPRPW